MSSSLSSPQNNNNNRIENVLILQGGGSLGAFGCGVFKGLSNINIRICIVVGTLIGGINDAIIAGNKDKEHPEVYWSNFDLNYQKIISIQVNRNLIFTQFVEHVLFPFIYHPSSSSLSPSTENEKNLLSKTNENLQFFYSSAIFGNDKMFKPIWLYENPFSDPNYFSPSKWTYI
jgi:NTE family protein